MNKVLIHGRIARDPEVRTTASGTQYARFSVAVDRPTKAGEEKKADFIPCLAWSKTAEFVGKYFPKGKEILCEGRIQTGKYTTESGENRYTTDVVIDRVEFCGSAGTNAKNTQVDAPNDIPF